MTDSTVQYLQSTTAIREQAQRIYQKAQNGGSHFRIVDDCLPACVDTALKLIHSNYPNLDVPFHSRWRHFEIGNYAQLHRLQSACADQSPLEQARIGFDVIVPSVLLDAGAGAQWRYSSDNSVVCGRSEGLALASLDMFLAGAFSHQSTPALPALETTALGLTGITQAQLEHAFKVTPENPLEGVEGRLALLHNLGRSMLQKPEIFPNQRPGDLVDALIKQQGKTLEAGHVFNLVIQALGDIWPGRTSLNGVNLGDTWPYDFGHDLETKDLETKDPETKDSEINFVPFHKLSQWLSYSLIETLINAGINVTNLDSLTGLAEYRNGGLLIDAGVLQLRQPELANQAWAPNSELIIEWRALTIILIEHLAEQIREKLQLSAEQLPLAKVLQGGTWLAGRQLAQAKRPDLSPPLTIISDGTVF